MEQLAGVIAELEEQHAETIREAAKAKENGFVVLSEVLGRLSVDIGRRIASAKRAYTVAFGQEVSS